MFKVKEQCSTNTYKRTFKQKECYKLCNTDFDLPSFKCVRLAPTLGKHERETILQLRIIMNNLSEKERSGVCWKMDAGTVECSNHTIFGALSTMYRPELNVVTYV